MKNIYKAMLAVSSLPCIMMSEHVYAEGTPAPNQQHGKSIMDEIVISASPLEEKSAGIKPLMCLLEKCYTKKPLPPLVKHLKTNRV